jgi:hypothetical protein
MLNTLLDGRFEDYVETTRRGAKLWLFVHVPQTAGSSLSGEFSSELKPYFNLHIDHMDRAKPAKERFDDKVAEFVEAAKTRNFRSASGHIWQQHAQTIRKAIPGVRQVTLLREPAARVLSDYNYQRSPMHPLHEEVIARTPDFMSFAEQPGPRNRMARHLVPMAMIRQERLEDAVEHVRRTFAFIGLQERYDLYFRLLTLLTQGRVKQPGDKKRVNEAKEKSALTDEQLERVRELNRVDFAIYDAVAGWLGAIEEDLAAWLDTMESPAEAAA